MKNALFAFTLLLSATPALAARAYTLKEMIAEVHYQAKQCGGSAMKSKVMEEEDTDLSAEKIGQRLTDRQTDCELTESRRMLALDKLSGDQPKPDVKPGWLREGTSERDSKQNQVKADRQACVLAAIYAGMEGDWADDEKAIAREPEAVEACERAALHHSEVIDMLN